MSFSNDELSAVIRALSDNASKGDEGAALSFLGTPSGEKILEHIEKNRPGDAAFLLHYPLSQAMRGVLYPRTVAPDEAWFLLAQYSFLEMHFGQWFKKVEGYPCSSDKSRTVVAALFRYFRTGQAIAWNYEAEYTYHLPKTIFTEHHSILRFFSALRALYYGQPAAYLEEVTGLLALVPKAPSDNSSAA